VLIAVVGRKIPEALEVYRDKLAIVERFAERDPRNTRLQREVAHTYGLIGGIDGDQRRLSGCNRQL
jgi:hypothetical protein